MEDVLSLVRSHIGRMRRTLAAGPTAEELAEMNAEMQVLTRMMQRLTRMAQEQTTVGAAPLATPSSSTVMPGMEAAPTITYTDNMSGMDMGGPPIAPMMPITPTAMPTDTMGSQTTNPPVGSVQEKLQTLTAEMQNAKLQLQTVMAKGASEAEVSQIRAKLENLQYLLRDVAAQLQSTAGPAPATLSSPVAAAASAVASGSSMSDMMQGMSGMMDSMMGGMGSSAASMPGMSAATPTDGAADPTVPTAGVPDATSLAQSAEAGGVTVTVTPTNLAAPSGSTLDFKVKVETHTVDLSQNLATISVLRMPSGIDVDGAKWDGPTGGHHIEGTLSFPRTDSTGAAVAVPATGTLTLSIRNYGGVVERTFTWNLAQ
jgi:hypothetical protein